MMPFLSSVYAWVGPDPICSTQSTRGSRAFSLVELLVVIGVVAILTALTIPAIGLVRRSASETQSLANLRSLAQSTQMYTAEYRGVYPYGTGGWVVRPSVGPPSAIGFPVWLADRNWPVFYHDVAPWPDHLATWLSPGANTEQRLRVLTAGHEGWTTTEFKVSYYYSNSFVADPRVWSSGATADEALVRAIHASEVRHPARKVIFYDAERLYLTEPDSDDARPVLFADGSADLRLDRDATEPVQNPFTSNFPPRIYHDTPDGVKGRDY